MSPSLSGKTSSYYVLGILFVVYLVNFVDRQILAILIEPIKADLELTDTQIGFLSGMAFAAFYVTMGIPLGRLVDVASAGTLLLPAYLSGAS